MRVSLQGMLRSFLPPPAEGSFASLTFPASHVTVGAVREKLGLPADSWCLAFHEGEPVADDHVLDDGDEVTFVAAVAGG